MGVCVRGVHKSRTKWRKQGKQLVHDIGSFCIKIGAVLDVIRGMHGRAGSFSHRFFGGWGGYSFFTPVIWGEADIFCISDLDLYTKWGCILGKFEMGGGQ